MRQRRSGGELRRRKHLAAAIGDCQRLAQMRAERREVFHRQRAAGGLDVGGDAAREIALVEIARAARGELRQRRLQPVLRQPHLGLDAPLRVRRQAVLQICGGARRIAPQVDGRACDHQRGPPVHQQAFAGELAPGATNSFHGILAWRRCASSMPATTPGTAIEPGPCRLRSSFTRGQGKDVGGRAVAGQRIVLDAQAVRRAHAVVDHLVAVFARRGRAPSRRRRRCRSSRAPACPAQRWWR